MGRIKMSIEEINDIVLSISKCISTGMTLKEALLENDVSIAQYNYLCQRLNNETLDEISKSNTNNVRENKDKNIIALFIIKNN